MSNNQDWYDDEEDLDFEDDSASTNSRGRNDDDVLKKVRRAERAKDKQLKEVLAELDSLRKFQRESNVSKVLSEKGINPKIAAFIPSDIEPTEIAVGSWLEQYGDVFGVVPQESQTAAPISANDLAALRQIDSATSNAMSPDGVNDMFSAINNAQSEEDLLNLIYGS